MPPVPRGIGWDGIRRKIPIDRVGILPQAWYKVRLRARVVGIARKHLGAFHETAGIEHQPEGEQRAFGALLLGVAARRLRIALLQPLKVGVGQVVQRDGALQRKQCVFRTKVTADSGRT